MANARVQSLKVLTLNCWGIPFISKDIEARFVAIANQLNANDYDIVALQEVWSTTQFRLLTTNCASALPYYHYFYSGMGGSGTCVLSKHPISNALYMPYGMNGRPYMLTHGDWFAGKGMGMCRVTVGQHSFMVMVTHTHAEYKVDIRKEYKVHRTVQFCDAAMIMRTFSNHKCDGVIVMGDFNGRPGELGHDIVKTLSGYRDVFLEVHHEENNAIGATCDRPDNKYTKRHVNYEHKTGQRIDYIWIFGRLVAESCRIRPWGYEITPGSGIPHSDHEPLQATLKITLDPIEPNTDSVRLDNLAQEVTEILQQGLQDLNKMQLVCVIFLGIVCLALYFFLGFLNIPVLVEALLKLVSLALIVFLAWRLIFNIRTESNMLTGGIANVRTWPTDDL